MSGRYMVYCPIASVEELEYSGFSKSPAKAYWFEPSRTHKRKEDKMKVAHRLGHRTKRTLYRNEKLIGMIDTPKLAQEIIEKLNQSDSNATSTKKK